MTLPDPLGKQESQTLVRNLLRDPDVVKRCLAAMSLGHLPLGPKFHCPLHPPDHDPSAQIRPPRNGHPDDAYVFMDYHQRDNPDRQVWPLASLFRAVKTDTPLEVIEGPSLLTWTLRMLVEAGVIAPAAIRAPKLAVDAPQIARTVYRGFKKLLAVKRLVEQTASPFTWKFASTWIGQRMSAYHVGKAIKWLLAKGYLVMDGFHDGVHLFLFGHRSLIRRRRMVAVHPTDKQGAVVDAVRTDREALWAKNEQQDADSRLRTDLQAHNGRRDGVFVPAEEHTINLQHRDTKWPQSPGEAS